MKLKETLENVYWRFRVFWDEIFIMFFKRIYWQIKYGFNIEDTWSIDYSMCKWLLPRIKYFKKHNFGFPSCKDLNGNDMTWDMWNYYLLLIEYWCNCEATDGEPIYIEEDKLNSELLEKFPNLYKDCSSEDRRIAKRTYDLGEKVFHTYFHSLWW